MEDLQSSTLASFRWSLALFLSVPRACARIGRWLYPGKQFDKFGQHIARALDVAKICRYPIFADRQSYLSSEC